ncbi:hypothetical protein [Prosthecobacter sp.]|uniref:hypothetical protein n=1 Tax=Prosthecobacter sp. TaxID=1965333 RepID=UPI002ABA7FE8|nr:hypothetical protein [Prosthecobacter sp.]MDZ4402121.1 hypothetical protein [Prosthecobacter sp.]
MEPFSPQDPLTKLLAQARKIEARSNFSQNVVRAARQTPQDRGWLAAVRAWWEDVSYAPAAGRWALAAGAAAAIALTFAVLQTQPEVAPQIVEQTITIPAPEVPLLPAAETPWETAYQTEALLAVEDTTQFTDSEIGFLLY